MMIDFLPTGIGVLIADTLLLGELINYIPTAHPNLPLIGKLTGFAMVEVERISLVRTVKCTLCIYMYVRTYLLDDNIYVFIYNINDNSPLYISPFRILRRRWYITLSDSNSMILTAGSSVSARLKTFLFSSGSFRTGSDSDYVVLCEALQKSVNTIQYNKNASWGKQKKIELFDGKRLSLNDRLIQKEAICCCIQSMPQVRAGSDFIAQWYLTRGMVC